MNAVTNAVAAATRSWSPYQSAIFDFVENGTGNAVVEAVAGSGKTTTIVEAFNRIKGQNAVFLAFGKAIATELVGRGVNAKTFHSLCFSPVLRFCGISNIDKDKLRRIIADNLTDADVRTYGAFINELVKLAREAGVGCLVEDSEQVWLDIAEHHDLEIEGDMARGIHLARRLLQASNESPECDFTDLLYRSVLEGISLPKFDFVFVDEAQDTNAIQRAILRKISHAGTRIVAVGDPRQAIYGFRGADSRSLDLITEEFNAIRLPLTVSYRCPKSVVAYARQWVSHIEAAPTASEGVVGSLGTEWNGAMFDPTDLIICRTTKPLVALAYRMLRSGQGCKILGKSIGEGLQRLITRMNAKGIDALVEKLRKWEEREVEKAKARGNEAKIAAIQDQAESIICLIESLPETDRTVPALLRLLDTIFDQERGCTTLATIHKAKGLEADRVYWLNSSQCPSKWARKDWQKEQEANLCYVAATRAKAELYLIEEERA